MKLLYGNSKDCGTKVITVFRLKSLKVSKWFIWGKLDRYRPGAIVWKLVGRPVPSGVGGCDWSRMRVRDAYSDGLGIAQIALAKVSESTQLSFLSRPILADYLIDTKRPNNRDWSWCLWGFADLICREVTCFERLETRLPCRLSMACWTAQSEIFVFWRKQTKYWDGSILALDLISGAWGHGWCGIHEGGLMLYGEIVECTVWFYIICIS